MTHNYGTRSLHVDAVVRYIECQERGNAVDGNARTRYAVSESPKNAVTRYSTKGDAVTRYAVYRISWGTPRALLWQIPFHCALYLDFCFFFSFLCFCFGLRFCFCFCF